ncbi:MAG: NUDIX domain-containing protein [Pseudomonadota bacterium]
MPRDRNVPKEDILTETEAKPKQKSYVTDLRSVLGTRPLILVGATVIVWCDSRVLMQLRSDNQRWSFPGGMMEPGESVEDAATRELFEETRIDVDRLHLVGIASGQDSYYKYPNGDEVYNVTAIFETKIQELPQLVQDDESTDLSWFELRSLPDEISPPTVQIIKIYSAYLERLKHHD